MPTQTEEQRRAAFQAAGLSADQQAAVVAGVPSISSGALEPTPSLRLPPPPQPADFTPAIETNLVTLLSAFNAPSPEEGLQSDLQGRLLSSLEKLGTQTQRKRQLETEAGLPGQRQELQTVVNQIQALAKERALIPTALQQESEGRGRTVGGVQPIETGRLRENAIKALSLSAIGQTLQGNISLAEANIQQALDAEFEPERVKLQLLQQAYEFNKDALERVDKKRSATLNVLLEERARALELQQAQRKSTYEIMLEAVRSGAPSTVANQMANSTPDRAIQIGAQYLGADFRMRADQIAFDNGVKTRELALRESEFALQRKATLLELAAVGDTEAIKELGYDPRNSPLSYDEVKALEDQRVLMQRDIDVVNRAMSNSTGIETSSGLVRSPLGSALFNPLGGLISAPFKYQAKNDFLADAGYVVKNLTFNKIRELSDAGVKLTPISEKELKAMADASSVLASSAIYDDSGNLSGFRISEDRVREQLDNIRSSYQRAKDDLTVNLTLSEDEKRELLSL